MEKTVNLKGSGSEPFYTSYLFGSDVKCLRAGQFELVVVDAFFGVTEHLKGVFHGCVCRVQHSAKKGWRRDSHRDEDGREYTTNDQRILEANSSPLVLKEVLGYTLYRCLDSLPVMGAIPISNAFAPTP